MTSQTSLDEIFSFLDYVQNKGFMKKNTALARRTACNKLFSVLEAESKNAEYVRDNIDVIKKRYQNLNADTTGLTIDEYARRVTAVLDDFFVWREDRGGWERSVSSKTTRTPKKEKTGTKAVPEETTTRCSHSNESLGDEVSRYVTFPLRNNFEGQIKVPKEGLTKAEAKRYMMVLLTHCNELHEVKPTDVEFLLTQGA